MNAPSLTKAKPKPKLNRVRQSGIRKQGWIQLLQCRLQCLSTRLGSVQAVYYLPLSTPWPWCQRLTCISTTHSVSQIRSRWHSRPQQHTVGSYTTTWQKYCKTASNFWEANSWCVLKRRGVGTDHRFSLELFAEPDCSLTVFSVCIPPQWLKWLVLKRRGWYVVSAATPCHSDPKYFSYQQTLFSSLCEGQASCVISSSKRHTCFKSVVFGHWGAAEISCKESIDIFWLLKVIWQTW